MFLRASINSHYYRSPSRGQRTIQDPVGIVYGNGRPIGFLQPYGNVYQITADDGNNQPNKREYSDGNPEAALSDEHQAISKYNSEYPALLTNFKIDSRLKNRDLPIKRQYPAESPKVSKRDVGLTRQNVDRLKEALQNYEETAESKASLHEILGEMGFAEVEHTGLQKRESALEEDEDMEKGVNAIRLVKETHDVEKRKSANSKKPAKQKEVKLTEGDTQKDNLAEDEEGEQEEEEGEQKTREKRNESTTQAQNSELMKNLEKSGDLTVSGNKSPLASVGETPKGEKQNNDKETLSETDEERVAREIQAKIDAIKDQVKRQIAEAKVKDNGERKKREANNLLRGETLQINPQYNSEDGASHVRPKRNIEPVSSTTPEDQDRDKRGLNIPLSPYHEENEDMDTEDDEFDDDGFQDRTALTNQKSSYYRHPRVVDDLEWENSLLYDDVINGNNFARKKRHDKETQQKMFKHLSMVKERSDMPKDYPKDDEQELKGTQEKLRRIADMSDADLFGPLPEGFPGELARYKRVKRGPLKQKKNE